MSLSPFKLLGYSIPLALLISSTLTTSTVDHFHRDELYRSSFLDGFEPPKAIWGRREVSSEVGHKKYKNQWSKALSSSRSTTPEDETSATSSYRLPLEVIPFHYFLEIIPILEQNASLGNQWTAPGNVKILVVAVKPMNTVTFHALSLNISQVLVVNRSTGKEINVTAHNYSLTREDHYIILLEKELIVGENYEIGITFTAPIYKHKADGLYRSSYADLHSQSTKYLVSTQLEFFHARQVFPCFDEPALKAKFDIAIGRSANFTALSNSNRVSSVPLLGSFGWFIDTFNTTVEMSAYLVAFVVSDYTFSEADLSILNGKPVRVYAPDYVIDKGAGIFGANVSAHVLAFYEKYFENEYPLPKMDSVAVPGFQHGAMENYGLNIYREVFLLDLHGVTSELGRSRVSSVIAHELAHQYFGNLVTCKWWNNIWLNEGFATYYSYIAQNATNPEFEPMKQLLREGPQYAMILDSYERSSYPLLLTAETQDELEDEAIGLPYYKGASMIRMMRAFLTPETFDRAIRTYLKKWAYKAPDQDDLFEVLTEVAYEDGTLSENTTVKEIMDPWTNQRGFPLVRVISADNDTVYVLYEKFRNSDATTVDKGPQSSWPIPISIATQDNPDFEDGFPKFWIPVGSVIRKFKHDTSKWIVVNPDATGFYRVMYDQRLTKQLQHQFNKDHEVISVFSRSQILDDYFTLAMQMELPISDALEFTKHFADESEEIVWIIFIKNIKRLFLYYSETQTITNDSTVSQPEEQFVAFRNYMLPRLEGILVKIGIEQRPEDRGSKVMFRARLLNWACRLGSKLCLSYAHKLFALWWKDPEVNPVPVDLQDFMYCYGVATKGPEGWFLAHDRYHNTSSSKQKDLLATSLGCVKDQDYLKIILESIINGEVGMGELEDKETIFESVAINPVGRPVLLNFLKTFLPKIKDTEQDIVWKCFKGLGSTLHTEKDLLELQEILDRNFDREAGEFRNLLQSYIGYIGGSVTWIEKHYEPMRIWFEQQQKLDSSRKVVDNKIIGPSYGMNFVVSSKKDINPEETTYRIKL